MAGYSKRTLIEKLGLRVGQNVYLENTSISYEKEISEIKDKINVIEQLVYPINFIHFFTTDKENLEKKFPDFKKALVKDGMIWISWPKGSSKIPNNLNENVVRELGLKTGLVDVKVAAIDENWSGLKFVFRLKDRH